MTAATIRSRVTVSVTVEWPLGERPRSKPSDYREREAEWSWLRAKSDVPVIAEHVCVTGAGAYVLRSGQVGRQYAEMVFGDLSHLPSDTAALLLAELQRVEREWRG